jgi:hypothetical protein
MILLVCPHCPPGYPDRRIIAAIESLKAGAPVDETPPYWQEYKWLFLQAQHYKCAWCESPNVEQTGAVDHFAPKGAIGVLVTHGNESSGATNVAGRTIRTVHTSGYVHLCYEWSNWLFSCERCNSGWKRTLFPVAEDPHPDPTGGWAYTPMLLHPFLGPDPEDHLEFDSLGQIRPRAGSTRGAVTIETLGLTRETLRRQRYRTREKALGWLKAIDLFVDLNEQHTEGLRLAYAQLTKLGASESPYAAVVRTLIREELGYTWREFQDLVR